MTIVPPFQSMPPAGHHEALAYRPACSQLVPSLNADGLTDWTVTLPDGTQYTLATIAPMPESQSHAALDASGLCKVGGADVPIVAPGHLLTLTQRPTVTNIPKPAAPPYGALALVLGAVVLGAIAVRTMRPGAEEQTFIAGGES
jgi:hypothetical protein